MEAPAVDDKSDPPERDDSLQASTAPATRVAPKPGAPDVDSVTVAQKDDTKSESETASTPDDIIEMYNVMFKDRYTDLDSDFKQTVEKPLSAPPCVKDWYTRPKRNFDWSRGRQGHRGRGGHYDRDQQQSYRGHGHRGQFQNRGSYDNYGPNRQQGHQQDRRYQPY